MKCEACNSGNVKVGNVIEGKDGNRWVTVYCHDCGKESTYAAK